MRFIIISLRDPLEQFSLVNYFYFNKIYLISLNNIFISLVLVLFIIYFFFVILKIENFNNSWIFFIFLNIFNFLKNILKSNLNVSVQIFTPFLFFIFLFILVCNVSGMIPYSFTLTSHFSLTFFLSLSFFIGANIFGILKNGIEFLNIFLPASSPVFISPLLFVVELVSYFARVFSLAIRLFANMMAGHALMKILAGFCWTFISTLTITGAIVGFIVFAIIFVVLQLELLIAFLQAYVFFMLTVVYMNDVVNTSAH